MVQSGLGGRQVVPGDEKRRYLKKQNKNRQEGEKAKEKENGLEYHFLGPWLGGYLEEETGTETEIIKKQGEGKKQKKENAKRQGNC
jgi:hypothetical protein